MKPFVVDTDVVSFLFKQDSRASLYLPYLSGHSSIISFMTVAELERWSLTANWGSKRTEWMRLFIARFVVVPYTHDLAVKWAIAMTSARRAGRPIQTADAWVAATALLYQTPLLTHNKSDYLGVDSLEFADRC